MPRETLYQIQYYRRNEHFDYACHRLDTPSSPRLELGTLEFSRICRWRTQQLPLQPHLELQEHQQKTHRNRAIHYCIPLLLRSQSARFGRLRIRANKRFLVCWLYRIYFQIHEAHVLRKHHRERCLCARKLHALQEMGV